MRPFSVGSRTATETGHTLIWKVDDRCTRLNGHPPDAAGVAVDERLLLSWTTGLHLDRD
jgi:hypothetical protein